MKSRLFSENDPTENKDFSRDLKRFLSLTHSQLSSVCETAIEFTSVQFTDERQQIVRKLAAEIELDEYVITSALGIASYFMQIFIRPDWAEEKAEDLAADLLNSKLIEESQIETVTRGLEELKRVASGAYFLGRRTEVTASDTLPNLTGLGYNVDFRAIWNHKRKSNEPVSSYTPKCLGAVPVVVVELRLKTGDESQVVNFQLSRADIDFIRDEFETVLRQIDIATDALGLGGRVNG